MRSVLGCAIVAWLVGLGFTPSPISAGRETIKGPVARATARPSVSFSPNPIKTGYTKDGSADIKAVASATVDPKDKIYDVEIKISGQKRVAIANIRRNLPEGTMTFEVRGISPTNRNKRDGDTTIDV